MFSYILSCILLFLIFYLNKSEVKDIGYPPTIYSLLWFFIIFIHFLTVEFDLIEINELKLPTLLFIVFGTIIFSLGGLIGRSIKIKEKPKQIIHLGLRKHKIYPLIIVTIICLYFLTLNSLFLIASNQVMEGDMRNLRYAINKGESLGIYKYGIYLSYLLFFIFSNHFLSFGRSKFLVVLMAIISIFYAVLSTGRTNLMLLFSLIFGLLLIHKKLNIRRSIYGFTFFFIGFFAYAIILGKGGDSENSLLDNLQSVYVNSLQYLLGGVTALGEYLNEKILYRNGENTFRFFYAALDQIGWLEMTREELMLTEEFIDVPFRTNVYTVYRYYLDDFGILFSFLMILIFGLVHTIVYNKSKKNRSITNMFAYSILLYCLLISFFQDQYISLLPTWIYYAGTLIFLLKIYPIFKKVAR